LIWSAWRAKQVMRGIATERDVGRHVARFILVGLYTGSRHGAICGAALQPAVGRGHVDLELGVFHRRVKGARETKKRQPPVRLPDRLLTHLRRWQRLGIATHAVVEWNGKPVRSVKKSFAAAVRAAGLPTTGPDRITPHVLRHTAATWAMQNGADLWQAAGFLGMTVEMQRRRASPRCDPRPLRRDPKLLAALDEATTIETATRLVHTRLSRGQCPYRRFWWIQRRTASAKSPSLGKRTVTIFRVSG
jgi:integrase